MDRVQVDIYKGDYEWHVVNLSTIESIKGLLKYRSRYDLLYDRRINTLSLESYQDLQAFKEEILCLYIWLDNVISKCIFTEKQKQVLELYVKGYTERDLAVKFNVTQSAINGVIKSICKKILEQNHKMWLDFIETSGYVKIPDDVRYKQCSKCGEWLRINKENFKYDKTNKRYKSRCRKCDN